jgi:hypothetical protein
VLTPKRKARDVDISFILLAITQLQPHPVVTSLMSLTRLWWDNEYQSRWSRRLVALVLENDYGCAFASRKDIEVYMDRYAFVVVLAE